VIDSVPLTHGDSLDGEGRRKPRKLLKRTIAGLAAVAGVVILLLLRCGKSDPYPLHLIQSLLEPGAPPVGSPSSPGKARDPATLTSKSRDSEPSRKQRLAEEKAKPAEGDAEPTRATPSSSGSEVAPAEGPRLEGEEPGERPRGLTAPPRPRDSEPSTKQRLGAGERAKGGERDGEQPEAPVVHGPRLEGEALLDRHFFKKRVTLVNKSRTSWNGCELRLNSGRVRRGVDLGAGMRIGILVRDFGGSERNDRIELKTVAVRCDEGSAVLPLRD